MGNCQSISYKLSQSRHRRKEQSATQNVTKTTVPDSSTSPTNKTNPFNFSTATYGGSEASWNILQARYAEQVTTLGADHPDTVVTLQQMCVAAWETFTHIGRTYAWESFLHTVYQRFRSETANHEDKIVFLNSIAGYLHSYTKASGEALPLYDALYSNLTQILGPTHETTLRTLQYKGLHYYFMQKYNESWNLLELVYNKLLHLNLSLESLIPCIIKVTGKFLEVGNLVPFKCCLQIMEKIALEDPADIPLILKTLTSLAELAKLQIGTEAAIKVYDDLIGTMKQKLGETHKNIQICLLSKAEFLLDNGKHDEAWEILEPIYVETNEAKLNEKPSDIFELKTILADLLHEFHNS